MYSSPIPNMILWSWKLQSKIGFYLFILLWKWFNTVTDSHTSTCYQRMVSKYLLAEFPSSNGGDICVGPADDYRKINSPLPTPNSALKLTTEHITGEWGGSRGEGERNVGERVRKIWGRKDKVERSGERSRGQEKDEKEKYLYNILLLSDPHYSRCHIRIYTETSLIWAPLGPK